MGTKVVAYSQFEGGTAPDPKVGLKHSGQFLQGFDFRKNPSQLSVLPGFTREDGGVVRDLILNEVMGPDGSIYSFGDQGSIYKRTVAGSYSEIGRLASGCAGMDYRKDTDTIYFTSNRHVSALINISTSASVLVNKYGPSYSTYDNSAQATFNVAAYQASSSLTTSIMVAASPLNEAKTAVRYFQTDIEPLNKISVFVVAKGTGDWTLTLHDGINSVLGTSTVTNANLINGAFNDFLFTSAPNSQVRVYPAPNARTYHIHVTSTVADGTVSSTVANDLSTCDLEVWADRLIKTNNGLHPMDRFLQYELIQNANYLSAWEPLSDPPTNAEWLRHRLTVPSEYEGCGLAHTNEFSVAAWGQTTTNTTSDMQLGLLTFWDGTSDTYNYDVPIIEGVPQALSVYKNIVYYYAGGAWWAMTSPTTQPVKLRTMPHTDLEFSATATTPITVNPYVATVRRGVQLFGFPSKTVSSVPQFGVYSWGSIEKNFPDAFGYDYIISTGSQNYSSANNLQIGMVQSYGDLLHVSWRDDSNGNYGIDVITNTSKPSPYAVYQGLTFDNGYVAKPKGGMYMSAFFYIPSGCTVKLSYQIDNGAWVYDTNLYSSTNLWQGKPNYAKLNVTTTNGVNGGDFHEFTPQIEVFCDSTVTVSPIIQTLGFAFDDKKDEEIVW